MYSRCYNATEIDGVSMRRIATAELVVEHDRILMSAPPVQLGTREHVPA
jgi:hypothetical protein